jgi:hypothetical protein
MEEDEMGASGRRFLSGEGNVMEIGYRRGFRGRWAERGGEDFM